MIVTRRVSEENLVLTDASLTRRVTNAQWLSGKRNFKTRQRGSPYWRLAAGSLLDDAFLEAI